MQIHVCFLNVELGLYFSSESVVICGSVTLLELVYIYFYETCILHNVSRFPVLMQ